MAWSADNTLESWMVSRQIENTSRDTYLSETRLTSSCQTSQEADVLSGSYHTYGKKSTPCSWDSWGIGVCVVLPNTLSCCGTHTYDVCPFPDELSPTTQMVTSRAGISVMVVSLCHTLAIDEAQLLPCGMLSYTQARSGHCVLRACLLHFFSNKTILLYRLALRENLQNATNSPVCRNIRQNIVPCQLILHLHGFPQYWHRSGCPVFKAAQTHYYQKFAHHSALSLLHALWFW